MKKILVILIFLVISYGVYRFIQEISNPLVSSQTSSFSATSSGQIIEKTTVITDKLVIPWSMVFLPDSSILLTERPGRVRLITPTKTLLENPIATLTDVKAIGEGGLLGIAINPNFSKNKFVYLYYTYSSNGQNTLNKVVRYIFSNNSLSAATTIVSNIPGNSNHNGGRIKFGPDGFLYITTGDSQGPSFSQDKTSLAGKILRVTDDGKPALGNPFNNLVYSYGHRNPQGLAWDSSGRLWATEHGPSTKDELNLIVKGGNYGWPTITGDASAYGMVTPVVNSGSTTWAPSGILYIENSLLFAGLRGSSLYKYHSAGEPNSELIKYLSGAYGRLRDVILGPDGYLYISTSNLDGRALTHLDGDKIIKIHPSFLQ